MIRDESGWSAGLFKDNSFNKLSRTPQVLASPDKPTRKVSRPDRLDPSFMGKNQIDDFASLTDPSSVDRGGNVIAPAPTALPLSGQVPSDIPPEDAFKITPRQDIDEMGMNQLYNK